MFPKGMEWIVILIIALLIFGPKNLPKLGKSLGSTVKNIREGMSGDDDAASEETVIEAGEDADDDAEIHELEAKLAAAKKKKEEDSNPVESH